MGRHLRAVARKKEIESGAKKALAIFPWRRNQRNSTGQRLERPDGRNAWKRLHVRPPWNVHRDAVAGENFRHTIIGQPAAVFDARGSKLPQSILGVSHTVHAGLEPQSFDRLDEKLADFPGALPVTPV